MKSLIPVSVILSTSPRRVYDETGALLTPDEKARLEQHSLATQAYSAALCDHERLIEDSSSLLSHLMRLCKRLKLNDAYTGIGTVSSAAGGAYVAIIDFNEYYTLIDKAQKLKIPPPLQVMMLPSEEIVQLAKNKHFQKALMIVFEESDVFADFVRNTSNVKLEAFLKATQQHHRGSKINRAAVWRNIFFELSCEKIAVLLRGIKFNCSVEGICEMSILHYHAKNDINALQMLVEEVEQNNRLHDINIRNPQGETILHSIANQPEVLLIIVSLLAEQDRVFAINERNKLDETVLHLVANHNIQLLERLIRLLPQHDRLRAINQRNHQDRTLLGLFDINPSAQEMLLNLLRLQQDQRCARLHAAIRHPDVLKKMLYRIPKEDCLESIIGINKSDETLLHLVNGTPDLLKVLLSAIPKNHRWLAVYAKNSQGHSLLHTIAENFELFKQTLNLIPKKDRFKAIYGEKGDNLDILHKISCNPDQLELILNVVPKPDRLRLVRQEGRGYSSVVDHIQTKPELHLTILRLIPKQERINYLTASYVGSWRGGKLLSLLANSTELLQWGLRYLPETDRLKAVMDMSYIYWYDVVRNPNRLGIIFSHLPVKDRLIAIKKSCALALVYVEYNTGYRWVRKRREDALELILSFLSVEDRMNALNEKDSEGTNFLHKITFDDDLFKLILNLYSEEARLNAIKEKDNFGMSVLFWAAQRSFESLKLALNVYPIEERLKAVEERDNAGQSALFHAAYNSFQSLELIIKLYPEEQLLDIIKRKNHAGKTIITYARHITESLDFILKIYPEQERADALKKELKDISYAHDCPRLITLIVSFYPEQERFGLIKKQRTKTLSF